MSSRKTREEPLLGALLRLTYQTMTEELTAWLGASRYRDLQPAHSAAIQPLIGRPEGARVTALAQAARITKQSMSALVEHLERTGYVERVDDPDDGRASRLRLTARGRAFADDVREFVRGVEVEWGRRVGARRVRELRETLSLIVSTIPSRS
jgi:DNA-binding MarR family transcriptional regulator